MIKTKIISTTKGLKGVTLVDSEWKDYCKIIDQGYILNEANRSWIHPDDLELYKSMIEKQKECILNAHKKEIRKRENQWTIAYIILGLCFLAVLIFNIWWA